MAARTPSIYGRVDHDPAGVARAARISLALAKARFGKQRAYACTRIARACLPLAQLGDEYAHWLAAAAAFGQCRKLRGGRPTHTHTRRMRAAYEAKLVNKYTKKKFKKEKRHSREAMRNEE